MTRSYQYVLSPLPPDKQLSTITGTGDEAVNVPSRLKAPNRARISFKRHRSSMASDLRIAAAPTNASNLFEETVTDVKQWWNQDLPGWWHHGYRAAQMAREDVYRNSQHAPEQVQQRCLAITDPVDMKWYAKKVHEAQSSEEAKEYQVPPFEITDTCQVSYANNQKQPTPATVETPKVVSHGQAPGHSPPFRRGP